MPPMRMRPRWQIRPEVWSAVLCGLLSGIVGALLFAAAHAVLIVPIWSRMSSGLVSGALAGAAAGWALVELYPAYATSSTRSAAGIGARLGGTLWLLVVPVTALDALLRATGVSPRFELVSVVPALILAAGGGAIFGWYQTHRRRGVISGGLATSMLTVAMAGPVPVARSPRAFGIFLAVLPAAVAGGALLALLVRQVQIRQLPDSSAAGVNLSDVEEL
jgi:hypothetical protein